MNAGREIRILRVPKERNFTVLDNRLLTDKALSWEARGLLCYLLSKPDDWQVRLYDLIRRGPAGEHKIRRTLEALQVTEFFKLNHRALMRNELSSGARNIFKS